MFLSADLQHCGDDGNILSVKIDDSRSRIRATNGIVGKEIQHGSKLEGRARAAVPKLQCRRAPH